MTTQAQLASEVYVITNRPDLAAETRVAIQKAIRKLHGADFWTRDLIRKRVVTGTDLIQPDPNSGRYTLDIQELAQFRKVASLTYPLDVPLVPETIPPLYDTRYGGQFAREFKELAANDLIDSWRSEKENYFCIIGNEIHVRASWKVTQLDLTYWQWPVITSNLEAQLGSWIASEYPDAIVEEACAAVFKMIGKDDEHGRFSALFAENLAIIRGTDVS